MSHRNLLIVFVKMTMRRERAISTRGLIRAESRADVRTVTVVKSLDNGALWVGIIDTQTPIRLLVVNYCLATDCPNIE